MDWSEQEAKYGGLKLAEPKQQTEQKQQPKPQGLGGLLLSLLPGGSLVDKKIRGEAITGGDVALEAGLSAVPFGLGKVARGIKSGAKILKGIKKGEDVAKVVQEKPEGLLNRFSKAASERSTLSPNSTIDSAAKQDELVNLAQSKPSLWGSARRKFKNVDGEISSLTDDVDNLFSGTNKTVPGKDVDSSLRLFSEEISDKGQQKTFNRIYDGIIKQRFGGKVPENMTLKDLNSIRRGVNTYAARVDDKLARGVTPSAADEAVLALKDEVSSMIDNYAPGEVRDAVKSKNREIATLLGGRKEFKRAAEEGGKLPVLGRVPLVSDAFASITQGAPDIAGRTLANPTGRFLTTQAATRLGADLTGIRDPRIQGMEQNTTENAQTDQLTQPSNDVPDPEVDQSPFALGNIETNVKSILAQGGTMKDVSEYIANAKSLNELTSGSKDSKTQEAAQKKITTASQAISQLEKLFGEAGGGQGLGGFAQRLLGRAKQNPNVEAYDKLRKTAAVSLARALGETGPLSDLDVKTYVDALPDVTDSPEAAEIKIRELKTKLQSMGESPGGDDISTQLQSLGL